MYEGIQKKWKWKNSHPLTLTFYKHCQPKAIKAPTPIGPLHNSSPYFLNARAHIHTKPLSLCLGKCPYKMKRTLHVGGPDSGRKSKEEHAYLDIICHFWVVSIHICSYYHTLQLNLFASHKHFQNVQHFCGILWPRKSSKIYADAVV